MCPYHIDVSPDDVNLSNMKISWWQRYLRIAGITIATGGLIVGWAFPVEIVGLVSQIDYLTEMVLRLWLDKLPNFFLGLIQDNTESAPSILAQNLPKASNLFSQNLLLQAFTVSGGTILQIGTLLVQFILSPIVDCTARQEFVRVARLAQAKWGTFFPVHVNLACVGVVHSAISPLALIFNVCTFSLFWIVYRYIFSMPTTFASIQEVCLIGLFFLVRDTKDRVVCFPQAITLIVVTIFTVLYTLNLAFGPLLTHLPITLEDDAFLHDEALANDNERRRLLASGNIIPEEQECDDRNDVFAEWEKRERRMDQRADEIEMRKIRKVRKKRKEGKSSFSRGGRQAEGPDTFTDQIEDLSPAEQDMLLGMAFQQKALRAQLLVTRILGDDLVFLTMLSGLHTGLVTMSGLATNILVRISRVE
ncbi:unnamed protein product [Tuber aestivum]|uniref:CSC1/OSCA1-like 7TM region domain-containing protein n=1 Tax=Tuber aestivum TaxID=59557 RepID=A0A292PKH0_9PEZI|nr:unnamed protein product [Tuber aestivum]